MLGAAKEQTVKRTHTQNTEFRTRKTAEAFIDVSTQIIAGRRAAHKGA